MKTLIYLLLVVLAGCAGASGTSDGAPKEDVQSGEYSTSWEEVRYSFSPNGSTLSCENSRIRVTRDFRVELEDCRGKRSKWVNSRKVAELKAATGKALKVSNRKIQCSNLGLVPSMVLEIKIDKNASPTIFRQFEGGKDCVRGDTDATESLNNFMATLHAQLRRT